MSTVDKNDNILFDMIKSRLSEILGKKRMTMSELKRMTGLSRPAVENLYHDRTKSISYNVVNKICWALEIDMFELFEYTPDDKI